MSQPESWTVKRLLEWTAQFLKSRGAETPRLEGEVLLAKALGCKRIDLYTNFGTIPSDSQLTIFRDFVRRRGQGEPVALLVGHKEFYSLDFVVTRDVLIPRPETEQLVLETLDAIKFRRQAEPEMGFSLCDLGTGSGNIATVIAKHTKNVRIKAIDMSEQALLVARENATNHEVQDRIDFVQSDLFSALSPLTTFDFIVSNPPYVTRAEYEQLSHTVRDYEPKSALLAGDDGLEVIQRIVADAPLFFSPKGLLLMEVSPMIIERVVALFKRITSWGEVRTIRDFSNRPRFVIANFRS